MKNAEQTENRGRQILAGLAVITVFTILVVGLLTGWRLIPGWGGESVGMVAGILSTPFFMEASFIVTGFLIVIGLNTWRRHKEGDECVYLDEDEK